MPHTFLPFGPGEGGCCFINKKMLQGQKLRWERRLEGGTGMLGGETLHSRRVCLENVTVPGHGIHE